MSLSLSDDHGVIQGLEEHGLDYPQPGGLDWDSLSAVAASALRNEPAGWDVTIYNPDLDPDGLYAARIVRFLGDAFARA